MKFTTYTWPPIYLSRKQKKSTGAEEAAVE